MTQIEFQHAVNSIGILSSRYFHIEMLVASAPFMAVEHDSQNVVTTVSDASCNKVQLRCAVSFFGGIDRYCGRTLHKTPRFRETDSTESLVNNGYSNN